MYHPSSKRKELAARILTYGLMTVTVVTLVAVSLFYTLGYRFDSKDHKLELSGLVQFVTSPSNAVVEIDGARHDQATPTKETLMAGSHEFVMWKEGYETWRKTLNIDAGTLTWLNYTRLVPKKRQVETVVTMPTLAQTLASPNNRYIAALADATKPVISFYNLSSDRVNESTLPVATDNYSQATTPGITHQWAIDQWDQDGRYLLLKHTYGANTEWVEVDRQTNSVVMNITRTFDTDIASAYFADNNPSILYAKIGDDVRRVNLSDKTVSAPLVSQVAEFKPYGNVIAYVRLADKTSGERVAGVVKDGAQPVDLYRSTSSPLVPVQIRAARYFNKDYAVVSDGASVRIMSGTFPESPKERKVLKTSGTFSFTSDVAWLQMSPSGRFIIAQNAASYAGYDLERHELSPIATLAGTTEPKPVKWLDDYYVWSDRSEMLTSREFDGANQHALSAVATGYDATLTQNGRWLYSIGKRTDGHYQLQRIRMILP